MPESGNPKEIYKLFRLMRKYNASDLHLKAARPPILRVSGQPRPLDTPPLTGDQVLALVVPIMSDKQLETLEETGDVDFSHGVPELGRFRLNTFRQRGSISVAVRSVKTEIPSFEDMHLPPVIQKIAEYESGLVLIAGVTGSGKSTTLAGMVQHINRTRRRHIVTIEDPIEYLFRDDRCFVNQREVGLDVPNFQDAMKYVVRQDPDVILIGEMRDPETFAVGLSAAETGHLVFGTLHSSTAASTIGRILDLFPSERQPQIRQQLRFNLKAIICQKLLESCREGVDVVPAVEVMVCTPTIRKLIAEGQDSKIPSAIGGGGQDAMQDFTESLASLIKKELISKETGMLVAESPEVLDMRLKGIRLDDTHRIIG